MKISKRKILSLALTFIMLIGLMIPIATMPVSAALGTGPGSIKITAPAGMDLTGKTFTAYQIFTATQSGTNFSYNITPAFSGFAASAQNTISELTDLKAYLDDKAASGLTAAEQLALTDALMKYIAAQGGAAAFTNFSTPLAVNTGVTPQTATVSGIPLGYYMVIDNTTPTGPAGTTVKSLCMMNTTSPAAAINIKADLAPKIDSKKVKSTETNYGSDTSASIGDTVHFQILTTVPDTTNYTKYIFNVIDTLSPGLTYVDNSLAVKVDGNSVLSSSSTWSVSTTQYNNAADTAYNGGTKITVTFDPTNFKNYVKGKTIEITYNATLNSNAFSLADEGAGNPNKVKIQYSNNPYDSNDGTPGSGGTGSDTTSETPEETPDNVAKVFTFEIPVFKTKADGSTALQGAEFELRTVANNSSTAITFTQTGTPGVYIVDPSSSNKTVTSPALGHIKMDGLAAGTYYLVETKAPDGYTAAADKTITITYTTLGTLPNITADCKINGAAADIIIENIEGVMFPSTGGIGTTIFYVGGSILTVGAGLFLLVRVRMNSTKKRRSTEQAINSIIAE